MRRALVLITVGALVAVPFVAGYRLSHGSRATQPVAVVDEVRDALSARYYRPVPASVLRLGSVDEMISALGDPYTAYLAPDDYKLLRQQTASEYTGIGVSVLPEPRGLVVVSLRSGPAERAGIHRGDVIVRIGGVPAAELSTSTAMARILGPRGSVLHLQLERAGRLVDVDVRRDVITAPVVDARLLSYAGQRIGVLQLGGFRIGASVVLGRQLRSLERAGATAFVLDLRGNPGGLLDQAVAVSSLFLDRGVVVSLAGAHAPHQVYRAVGGVATRRPLAVLVDRYTASSAEIVAAALRDHHRAVIVGERTFGKALVQSIDPLDNGAALEITIARYTTPAGDDISSSGVKPQIRAVDDPRTSRDEVLLAGLRVLSRPAS
jgi:carboxyl-terminal processing protease